MRIAILAWGSLIWQPANRHGELCLAPESGWNAAGPRLPIEFARISSDGRLTLIIVPDYGYESPALWSLSCHDELGPAVANLAERETNAPLSAIHGASRSGTVHGDPSPAIAGRIVEWLQDRTELDAALWTGLPPGPGWMEHGFDGFRPEHAVDYFSSLQGSAADRATEYILRAPTQIDTPVRRSLAPILG